MRAGRLKHIIHLQKNIEVGDERSGQKLQQWQTVYTAWAGIEPLRGKELYAAQQDNSEITLRIVMRWYYQVAADLDHTWSIVKPADPALLQPECRYEILHDPINPNMANRELHLMCKVVT